MEEKSLKDKPTLPDKKKGPEILVTDKLINKEKRKLIKIFASAIYEIEFVDGREKKTKTDRGTMLENLIEEAAFVRAVMAEAKRLIQESGIETLTVNASQTYRTATPATKIYSEYLRTYTPLINALIAYIPEKKDQKQARLKALREIG